MKKSWAKDYLRIEITITISTMNEDEFDSSRKERNYIRYLISQVIFPRNRGGGEGGESLSSRRGKPSSNSLPRFNFQFPREQEATRHSPADSVRPPLLLGPRGTIFSLDNYLPTGLRIHVD